jgi:hypothetical protein
MCEVGLGGGLLLHLPRLLKLEYKLLRRAGAYNSPGSFYAHTAFESPIRPLVGNSMNRGNGIAPYCSV